MAAKKYDESDIESHQGLKGIRLKPTMYIGEPDAHGLFTIGREPSDNFIDEWLAGRCDYGHIILDNKTQTTWIVDNGQGIPVGTMTIEAHGMKIKMPALQAIVSELHTGGKFKGEGGAYGDGSRGTHGIGIKATNALSKRFDVWTRRDGKIYHIAYEKGEMVEEMHVVKSFPALPHGQATDKKTGTVVSFIPDMTIFDKGAKLDVKLYHQWAELAAHLNGGMTIDVSDESGTTNYYSEEGAVGFLKKLVEESDATPLGDFFVYHSKLVDCAIAFTDFDGINVSGYTNGLVNPDGGYHVDNALKSVSDTAIEYKGAKQEFKGVDLQDGLVGVINIKIAAPKFGNQIKSKLVDERVPEPVYAELTEALAEFFTKNKALVKRMCERASQVAALKAEFKASKGAMKELKGRKGSLPKNLIQSKCNPGERELFLMEGDSAGGTAAKARDKSYQEVLPLRGKILNVYKLPKGKRIWDSEQVMDILKAIGYNPEAENPLADLRIGRLIMLGDADVDGYHVNLLNLSLITKIAPQMFEEGMVYIAKGYEYVIQTPEKNYYADSPTEMMASSPTSLHKKILHLKGWGEVSARGLSEMAFNPETRQLIQLKLTKTCIQRLHKMMGEDVAERREMLGI